MAAIPRVFVGWDILVVDDERDNLEIASRLLAFAGASVVVAQNGRDALTIVQTHPTKFKFVLSDLSMPDMDGWELLYLLRQEPGAMDIPIIALTAHAMPGDRQRGLAAGFHNYLTKPIEPMRFVSQLVEMLSVIPDYAALFSALPPQE